MQNSVSFTLDDKQYSVLHALADECGLGGSEMAKRIVVGVSRGLSPRAWSANAGARHRALSWELDRVGPDPERLREARSSSVSGRSLPPFA